MLCLPNSYDKRMKIPGRQLMDGGRLENQEELAVRLPLHRGSSRSRRDRSSLKAETALML
jgi:hypothetical protein